MNGAELGALRRLLMFSAAEAARWVAVDELRPRGVEERTWNRWESGKVPVPDNIGVRIESLAEWRAQQLRGLAEHVGQMWRATGKPVALAWYAEADDYRGPGEQWRPHCSALAALLDMTQRGELKGSVRLIAFDPGPFHRWAQALGLADDDDARSRWAEEQAADPLRAKDRAA